MNAINVPVPVPLRSLVSRYAGLLLDVYGVLITARGVCPGAIGFLEYLHDLGKPYRLITNSAAQLPEEIANRLEKWGLPVLENHIITAGSLLESYFIEHDLQPCGCVVLGTDASREYVRRAGGQVLEIHEDTRPEVVVICDDDGFSFLETINTVITLLFRSIDQGLIPHLVLPNPDLIYPRGQDSFGITAGAIALVIERVLAVRYPSQKLCFTPLGKPHAPIYQNALKTLENDPVLMIGDQWATDILGAQAVGIDSLLVVGQGVTATDEWHQSSVRPTYVAPSLALDEITYKA